MLRQELIDFCLTFLAVYEDYPFHNMADPAVWTAMRHSGNKKTFAFIYVHNEKLCVNLKCEPLNADFLRQTFEDVTPAYHMNKVHWNTVVLGGDVPIDELKRMIEDSYDLTKPKIRLDAKKTQK
ncbi:MAG: MmcQ/YjbR family DNA-binding protein [Defluviitaleaceae bacterium]|nr:MmcQ/YjbR family DNA-binding protein [Defluviitaleaceae bacterium]